LRFPRPHLRSEERALDHGYQNVHRDGQIHSLVIIRQISGNNSSLHETGCPRPCARFDLRNSRVEETGLISVVHINLFRRSNSSLPCYPTTFLLSMVRTEARTREGSIPFDQG
jgi:hypothetical protein